MQKKITFKLNGLVSEEEYNHIFSEIKSIRSEIETLEFQQIHSLGLTEKDLLVTLILNFSISITANATYDYLKLIIKTFKKKNIKITPLINKEDSNDVQIKELITSINKIFIALKKNAIKQIENNNQSAGKHARKESIELEKLMKEFRRKSKLYI